MKRFAFVRHGIAIIVVTTSFSASAEAQLPASKPSPLNQLGRWSGFGISDGYHECPEPTQRSLPSPAGLFARSAASTPMYPAPCVESESVSIFSRLNPFRDKANAKSSDCPTGGCLPSASQAGVLPPSPQMYQQFATPHETPLPHQQAGLGNSTIQSIDQAPQAADVMPHRLPLKHCGNHLKLTKPNRILRAVPSRPYR